MVGFRGAGHRPIAALQMSRQARSRRRAARGGSALRPTAPGGFGRHEAGNGGRLFAGRALRPGNPKSLQETSTVVVGSVVAKAHPRRVKAVQDSPDQTPPYLTKLVSGLDHQGAFPLPGVDHDQDAVDHLGERQTVRDRKDRGAIDQHELSPTTLRENVAHPIGLQQLDRLHDARDGTTWEDLEMRDLGAAKRFGQPDVA